MKSMFLTALAVAFVCPLTAHAQTAPPPLDAAINAAVINSAITTSIAALPPVQAPQSPTALAADPVGFAADLAAAVQGHHWSAVTGLAMLVVALLLLIAGKKEPWLQSTVRHNAIVVATLTIGAMGSALAGGAKATLALALVSLAGALVTSGVAAALLHYATVVAVFLPLVAALSLSACAGGLCGVGSHVVMQPPANMTACLEGAVAEDADAHAIASACSSHPPDVGGCVSAIAASIAGASPCAPVLSCAPMAPGVAAK